MEAFIGFSIVIAMIIFAVFFTPKAIVKRKLKKATLKKLSRFRSGDVAKIVGEVEVVKTALKAPLSERECAYYHVQVKELQSTGKNSSYKTIIDDHKSCDFVISESGFYAYIKGEARKTYIVKDKEYKSGFGNDAPAKFEKYLRSHKRKSEGWLGFNKSLKYFEGVLEVGEKIAVLGQGKWQNARELGLPDQFGDILVFEEIKGQPIYLSDDPDTLKFNRS